jgi:hypothetical protein
MNVLSFLDVIDRNTAFQLANVTDRIIVQTIIEFLDETYGVPHTLYEIYGESENENELSDDEIYENLEMAVSLLEYKLTENKVLIAIFYGKKNHMATIAKMGDYYFIDPQNAKQIKLLSEEMVNYMKQFYKIDIIESPPPIQFKPNLPKLKRRLEFEATRERIKQNPRLLETGLQHRIIPGERYQYFHKNTGKGNSNSLLSVSNYHARFRKKTLDPMTNYYFKHIPKSKKVRSLNKSKSKKQKTRRSI